MAFTQEDVNNWFTANPNATQAQVAQTVQGLGGLTANPELAGMIGQHYGADANTVTNAYNQLTTPAAPVATTPVATTPVPVTPPPSPFDQMANAYQAGDYTGVNSLLSQNKYTPAQIQQQYGLSDAQMDDIRTHGVNLGYTNPQVQSYVSGVLGDTTLAPWEQTNKILETAQRAGVGMDQLQNIYGANTVNKALGDYKTGIQNYLTNTLATEPGTTMNEVGAIHQAAQKYGLTPDEIAKYGGLDPKVAQSYFDMYDKGLGTIVANLADHKTDDLTKTQTALALQQKFGTTDAELAKASNGKYTEKDIKSYLDPVRNVPGNLQKLFDDPNATAADITKFVNDAKKDPRAAGIYGAALDKVLTSTPELYLRDASMGKADTSDSYEKFLSIAKATPESAAKYAPQIKAIEQAKNIIGMHALNKDFGGEYKDYAMQMFLGLDQKTAQQAPKQLELTPAKKETVTALDDNNMPFTYTRVVAEPAPKEKGIEPIYGNPTEDNYGGEVVGYRKKVDSAAFDATGKPVYATYDANGKLTGYESNAHVHINDPQWYGGKWDANGNAKPITGANRSGGFFKNTLQDIASLGPAGQIALMAMTGGAGSALAASLGGGALANAAASGLISGALSEVGGGDFGKGFLGGAAGSGIGSLVQGAMPTGGLQTTGVPMIDSYLTQALPKAAGSMASAGVMGNNVADAGLYSLINTGVNKGTTSLLNNVGLDTLPTSVQPYASGVASNLVSSLLTGKDPNLTNALTNTALQQARSGLTTAAKS
jgi:hypothetical protein